MKALILLEQFILSRQATNAQHQEALKWLSEIQKHAHELEQKLESLNNLDNG